MLFPVIQVVGVVIGAANLYFNVYPPVKAFQAGQVVATFSGFYAPMAGRILASLLAIVLPQLLPQWKSWLAWLKGVLPDDVPASPEAIVRSDLKLAKAALAQRHKDEAKNLEEVVRARVQEAIADATGATPVVRAPRSGGGKKTPTSNEE